MGDFGCVSELFRVYFLKNRPLYVSIFNFNLISVNLIRIYPGTLQQKLIAHQTSPLVPLLQSLIAYIPGFTFLSSGRTYHQTFGRLAIITRSVLKGAKDIAHLH